MITYIALLRGINVGGNKMIAMATLRAALTVGGMQDVRTYIQSGNVVFRARKTSSAAMAKKIEQIIEATFDMDVTVMVRTREELDTLIADNPYRKHALKDEPNVHVWVLSAEPDAAKARELCALSTAEEELQVHGRQAYQRVREGIGNSMFGKLPLEKRLGVRATARKLSTLEALARLAAE